MGNEEYREKAPQDAGQPARRAGLKQAPRDSQVFMPGDGFYLNKVILFLEMERWLGLRGTPMLYPSAEG